MAEVRHAEFEDAEGVTYTVETERGVISIQESGGHNETYEGDSCQGCVDCIETIAIWPQDVPKLIAGLQAAVQHAAMTGEYNAAAGDEILRVPIRRSAVTNRYVTSDDKQSGQLCNMETGEHVIPHRGCILR
ncbi:hypothetical protein SEA_JORDAN_47 [Arthrobacter phage Jordan]|nr:hypothetical protein SEA_JORDAN_47 [Arthrobacter phage Jordan]